MIRGDLFQGGGVRLSLVEPEVSAKAWARWNRNSIFHRYLDNDPANLFSPKKIQEWIEKENEGGKDFSFHILTQPEDRFIGFVSLFIPSPQQRDAWVAIGIGEASEWSKGYGTGAMLQALRYAFLELNLHRVSLGVFEYNRRAIRSYEKAGFILEGIERGVLNRDGERANIFYMGILRSEWEAINTPVSIREGVSDGK
jgi:RimJ/RimL family protein N-acetyltransferase